MSPDGGRQHLPFAKMIGGMMIVSMNSVARYSKLRDPVGSNGWIGDGQFARADEVLSSPLFKHKKKIVLIHHHFHKQRSTLNGTMHGLWSAVEQQAMKLRKKKRLLSPPSTRRW